MQIYQSSTSQIHAKLDQLVNAMRASGYPVENEFNPGLSREEIARLTRHLPFEIPEELYQLYTWRNGTKDDTELFMYRDHHFISLEQALIEYQDVVEYYEVLNALPFAAFNGAWLVLPSKAYQVDAEIWPELSKNINLERPVISVFEGVKVFAYSFSIMLEMVIDWFEQGAREKFNEPFDSKRYYYRQDLERRIWEKHNLGIFNTPELVYTPAEGFQQVVTLRALTYRTSVGLPVALSATRSCGPLKQAKLESLPIGTCWWSFLPLAYEAEVINNLRLSITPEGYSRANSRNANEREIVFSKPGKYQITGHSAAWCHGGVDSNTIEIEVI